MKVALDTQGTIQGFMETLDKVMQEDETQGLLVLSCAGNDFTAHELDPLLKEIEIPLFGGCFPAIICEKQAYERGTLAVSLPVKPKIQVIENLSRSRDNFDDEIDASLFGDEDKGTMFVIVDGMSLHVNSLLESIFTEIGLGLSYIGGGAASIDLKLQPCLITNEGLRQDCAILSQVALDSGVGIAHGMRSVSGPHKVTGASFNMITTIDWQPAATFYKDMVLRHSDNNSEKQSFIETDAHYSLGLNRYDSERVILEPVMVGPDDSLCFMMEVREGEFVDIMHITEKSMVQSAESAVKTAYDVLQEDACPQTLISFDCISRKLFLDNRFNEELAAICSSRISSIGALTCGGEIGTSGLNFLDYHNRTCVVGSF